MLSLEEAQKRILAELEHIQIPSEPGNLYAPVEYILSNGGKRIRPSLVLLGANVFSDDVSEALSPAVGIEIFHNFTLLHDDLMDHSAIRRGKKTVHLKWNPNIAILSGDVMSIMANEFISKVDERHLRSVLAVFNRTALEVCEGQMMDMDFETRDNVSINEYLEMIRLKTSVLIAGSLEIGAITAGAGEKSARELYEFGLNLGLAFQLQDDLLDSYGDTGTFGKKVGNDILTNKKTYLMISALQLASPSDLTRLKNLMEQKETEPSLKIQAVREIFDIYNVKSLITEKINSFFNLALQQLDKLEVPEERKSVLRSFSYDLMKRNK